MTRWATAVLAAAFSAPLLHAQSMKPQEDRLLQSRSGESSLYLRFFDASGAVIPGTKVLLVSKENGKSFPAESDGDGAVHFSGLTPGSYNISATRTGFIKFQRSVLLKSGTTLEITPVMQVGGVLMGVYVEAAPEPDSNRTMSPEVPARAQPKASNR